MVPEITQDTADLSTENRQLVETAAEVTERAFDPDRWGGAHMVGAALRATDGEVFTGVSLPASVGRASMCAEPVALGNAAAAGEREFEAIVAVRHPLPEEDRGFEAVAACGACRELIADYGPDISVVVPEDGALTTRSAMALLPGRTW